jgi:bacterioferritin
MRGNTKVIEYLNKGLRHELTAVNQYWLHYRLLDKSQLRCRPVIRIGLLP